MSVRLPLVAVVLWLASACGDDDQVAGLPPDAAPDSTPDAIVRFDAPTGDPVGGWQMGSTYACFSSTSSADFGDSVAHATTTPCCYWDATGMLYYQNNVTGTWTVDPGDRLVITQDPPCGDACGPFAFTRLSTITCQF